MNINVERLEKLVADMRETLQGLLSTEIWMAETGESLAAHNGQPMAVGLANKLTDDLNEALAASGFPVLNRYFMLDLEGDMTSLIIQHRKDVRQGVLVDTRFTNIGTMLALGMPMALRGVEEARTDG